MLSKSTDIKVSAHHRSQIFFIACVCAKCAQHFKTTLAFSKFCGRGKILLSQFSERNSELFSYIFTSLLHVLIVTFFKSLQLNVKYTLFTVRHQSKSSPILFPLKSARTVKVQRVQSCAGVHWMKENESALSHNLNYSSVFKTHTSTSQN